MYIVLICAIVIASTNYGMHTTARNFTMSQGVGHIPNYTKNNKKEISFKRERETLKASYWKYSSTIPYIFFYFINLLKVDGGVIHNHYTLITNSIMHSIENNSGA